MKLLTIVLFLSGCASIRHMEAGNAKCLEYCEQKYGGLVLATGEWPCDCVCEIPKPIMR